MSCTVHDVRNRRHGSAGFTAAAEPVCRAPIPAAAAKV